MLLPIKLSNGAPWYMIFIPSIFGKGNFALHFAHHLIVFDHSERKILIVTELLLMLLQIYKHSKFLQFSYFKAISVIIRDFKNSFSDRFLFIGKTI